MKEYGVNLSQQQMTPREWDETNIEVKGHWMYLSLKGNTIGFLLSKTRVKKSTNSY